PSFWPRATVVPVQSIATESNFPPGMDTTPAGGGSLLTSVAWPRIAPEATSHTVIVSVVSAATSRAGSREMATQLGGPPRPSNDLIGWPETTLHKSIVR